MVQFLNFRLIYSTVSNGKSIDRRFGTAGGGEKSGKSVKRHHSGAKNLQCPVSKQALQIVSGVLQSAYLADWRAFFWLNVFIPLQHIAVQGSLHIDAHSVMPGARPSASPQKVHFVTKGSGPGPKNWQFESESISREVNNGTSATFSD